MAKIWARKPIAALEAEAAEPEVQALTTHDGVPLKRKGPVTIPREFVFMDRAAIGLGAVFLHLRAELNFYRLFNEAIEHFSMDRVATRQQAALAAVGL